MMAVGFRGAMECQQILHVYSAEHVAAVSPLISLDHFEPSKHLHDDELSDTDHAFLHLFKILESNLPQLTSVARPRIQSITECSVPNERWLDAALQPPFRPPKHG